jgi:lipoprotein-anchoring transpeptidase ErfK/SrfK
VSRRELLVRRDGRVVERLPVGVGKPSTPTPPGLYAVTDKLLVRQRGSPYGCCILALTGHQPRVPQGWGGGDRLAIHSTTDEASIGLASSNGCLRASGAAMRRLVRAVPLGTRVKVVA